MQIGFESALEIGDRAGVARHDRAAPATIADDSRRQERRVFADAHYLADWPGATDAGSPAARRRPVTQVSWFAARAYCASLKLEIMSAKPRRLKQKEWHEVYRAANDSFAALSMHLDAKDSERAAVLS